MPRQTAHTGSPSVPPMITFIIAIAVLYFARQILIPFALAMLCAFLLSPVVKRLEHWRIPRIAAVLCVLLLAVVALASVGWVVTDQLVDITNELPRYRENIRRKVEAVQGPGTMTRLLQNIDDIGRVLTPAPKSNAGANTTVLVIPKRQTRAAKRGDAAAASNASPAEPMKVEVVAPQATTIQSLRSFIGPVLGPLETLGLMIVFTIFMLIDREDLRNRLLGLVGQRQLHLTTKAMDDAAQRVSRYLLMQFLVNASVGTLVGLGLFLIGVQSYLLWGVMAMLLRFLPYVGIVLAGAFPFVLAVATTEGWRSPALVIALFVGVEMITGNMVEPMLYGAHTGLSAVAILVAAVFWTALWGPVGLILATPLTVCLGVLGRYSPDLQFLSILLGDEPVLTPDALFYQRLLALDHQDALAMAENFLKDKPVIELYDQIIVPALVMAERDRHGGQLEESRGEFVVQSIREFVTELAETDAPGKRRGRRPTPQQGRDNHPMDGERKVNRVFCLAANDTADEITAAMFAQLVDREGYPALAFPVTNAPVELLEGLQPQAGDFIFVSSVPPLALTHARTVTVTIRDAFPEVTILVGLWKHTANTPRTLERLQQATGSAVITSFAEGLAQIRASSVSGVTSQA